MAMTPSPARSPRPPDDAADAGTGARALGGLRRLGPGEEFLVGGVGDDREVLARDTGFEKVPKGPLGVIWRESNRRVIVVFIGLSRSGVAAAPGAAEAHFATILPW